jgi:L-cysteine:1D-myo-inositol 2-amino-2-deoxy-alpha-D-glucopyranoside ligase
MRLYDTARQAVVPFWPSTNPDHTVTMYTCGITPYDAAHVGHAATYIAYDVLRRRLHDRGLRTKLVRNVTDVDDDILRKARELGVHYLDLAAEEMARFSADMDALGLLGPEVEPRATSAIPDILGFIGMVLESGHAYQAGGAVYFDVSSWPKFGELSHYGPETMLELASERGGNPGDPNKDDPLDFVLWQPSGPGEPAWDSLWGRGRPGWHIECSALAVRELGETVDLHGGGTDLIFPHHECETAQSEAATRRQFVRHWMHVAMVHYEGAKMSKSLGNLVFVHDLLKQWEPAVVRLAVLAHHYRSEWTWHEGLLLEAATRLELWRAGGPAAGTGAPAADAGAASGGAPASTGTPAAGGQPGGTAAQAGAGELLGVVRAALDDDLDTPRALVAIDAAARGSRDQRGAYGQELVGDAASLLGVDLAAHVLA